MAEENEVVETTEASTPDATQVNSTIDVDQKVRVGGEEYSARDLAEAFEHYNELQEYAQNLEAFQQATMRLMNPDTDASVKKQDARNILLASNYPPEKVDEWIKIYDETPEMPRNSQSEQQPDPYANAAYNSAQKANEDLMKLRAQILQQNMENAVSTSLDSDSDGKVLMDWIAQTKSSEEVSQVKANLAERVRAQALENLRHRRNMAGSFEDSWLGEEVQKAANKVAKDMLTVIGDTSKIGRVPETAGQTETLYRKDPVKLPDTKGKSFGDVEGQLRSWTTDQILRSLSDPGGDSKA